MCYIMIVFYFIYIYRENNWKEIFLSLKKMIPKKNKSQNIITNV